MQMIGLLEILTRIVSNELKPFTDHAYESHRHDTFAIGRTLTGVQSFHYRGEMKHSQPGMTMVLHPDEKHDGESGSRDGFRYRMVYVEPATLQEIMKGKPLPFFLKMA